MAALHSIWRQVVSLASGMKRGASPGQRDVPGVVPGLVLDAPSSARSSDPDFSEEFGYERGFAGGSGFENVEFDKWV